MPGWSAWGQEKLNGLKEYGLSVLDWIYPSVKRIEDGRQFVDGVADATVLSPDFTYANAPHTALAVRKLLIVHGAYLAIRVGIEVGMKCGFLYAFNEAEDQSSWKQWGFNWMLYLGCVATMSTRWMISSLVYNTAVMKYSQDEMMAHFKEIKKELQLIDYPGKWEDKKTAGVASLFYYLADYHAALMLSHFVPLTQYITFPLIEGRGLIEGNMVLRSVDGIPTDKRREILADNIFYCLGFGSAFYFTYWLAKTLIEQVTGINHPTVNATLYSFLYSLFVMQAYQIRSLPGTSKRMDPFTDVHALMERWLQRSFNLIVWLLKENQKKKSHQKLDVFFQSPSMKFIKKHMIGYENWEQYLKREEMGFLLCAYEPEIKSFFTGVLEAQSSMTGRLAVFFSAYVPELILSPTTKLVVKKILSEQESLIQRKTYEFLLGLLHAAKINMSSKEIEKMKAIKFFDHSLTLVDNYSGERRKVNPLPLVASVVAPVNIQKENKEDNAVVPLPAAKKTEEKKPIKLALNIDDDYHDDDREPYPKARVESLNLAFSFFENYDPASSAATPKSAASSVVAPPPKLQ